MNNCPKCNIILKKEDIFKLKWIKSKIICTNCNSVLTIKGSTIIKQIFAITVSMLIITKINLINSKEINYSKLLVWISLCLSILIIYYLVKTMLKQPKIIIKNELK